jgi:amidophosphoribosyltransferase
MCGILVAYNNSKFNTLLDFLVLLEKIQHRGQDSFGFTYYNNIKTSNVINLVTKTIKGLIKDNLIENINYKSILSKLFIGHTRYITSGIKTNNVSQPISGLTQNKETFIICFNGNINLDLYKNPINNVNYNIDTELIVRFFENESNNNSLFETILVKFMNTFDRAYSIVIYFKDNIYCLRDRYGVRPLLYNITNNNLLITSESCINKELKYTNIEEGQIIKFDLHATIKVIDIYNIHKNQKIKQNQKANCLFEYIYFMNKDSEWNNINIYNIRGDFGKSLAKDENINIVNNPDNYIVIGIPNSGIPSAIEYSKTLNIPYKQYINKNPKINRTFILKDNEKRIKASKEKYIYNKKELNGKNIILFDDSIVRGITIKNIISKLKTLNVKEIHIRIASPPIKYECYYGIDIPTKKELIANNFSNIESINTFLGSTSLKYINIEKIKELMGNLNNNLCSGCFNNNYNSLLDW